METARNVCLVIRATSVTHEQSKISLFGRFRATYSGALTESICHPRPFASTAVARKPSDVILTKLSSRKYGRHQAILHQSYREPSVSAIEATPEARDRFWWFPQVAEKIYSSEARLEFLFRSHII